jgi:D-3-phosphoglycerate dehydrogenase / 2-oxoglutarate reductase
MVRKVAAVISCKQQGKGKERLGLITRGSKGSMSKYKTVVTDYVFPSLKIEREELAKIGADLVECDSSDEDEIIRKARDADAVLTCYARITPKVINSLERCRVISRYGTGVDNVDIPSATRKRIAVTYVPDYCVEEVSDHALALIFACTRKVCQLNQTAKNGTWDYKGQRPLRRLRGQTLGLIGFGKIPRRLADKVKAFGFRVLAYDPYLNAVPAEHDVKLVELGHLLQESDIVSVHAPLTSETRGLLGYEQLRLMKRDSFLVNTARGGLIKEDDLVRALNEGLIAGAGLDVLANEQFDPCNPLLGFDNVVITPHVAFYSEQSLQDLQTMAVMEVVRVLSGQEPLTCLNPQVLSQ